MPYALSIVSSIIDLQCLTENLNNQSELWTEVATHNRNRYHLCLVKMVSHTLTGFYTGFFSRGENICVRES